MRRDIVKLVGELSEDPDRVKDSGAGSTTLTVKMHEWLTFALDPVIVTLYFPEMVDVMADTCRLVLFVAPAVRFTGF